MAYANGGSKAWNNVFLRPFGAVVLFDHKIFNIFGETGDSHHVASLSYYG